MRENSKVSPMSSRNFKRPALPPAGEFGDVDSQPPAAHFAAQNPPPAVGESGRVDARQIVVRRHPDQNERAAEGDQPRRRLDRRRARRRRENIIESTFREGARAPL